MRKIAYWLAAALLLLSLSACGGDAPSSVTPPPTEPPATAAPEPTPSPEPTPPAEPYEAPPFADAEFHEDQTEGTETVRLDLSAMDRGYASVSAVSEKRLKLQVICGEVTYNYDLPGDGSPTAFPLQSGDGLYRFRVMENVEGGKYVELCSAEGEAVLADEFQPYLRPNCFVPYSRDSVCVKKAAELAKMASDSVGVVAQVYDFICGAIDYDAEKAQALQTVSGYSPDPDAILASGKGICFDYASLAAAMLRSQGIPTKMVHGYVSPDDLYHAWNMFYTEETGWVTAEFQVKPGEWNRLDLTFSAGGSDAAFVGDGNNYHDVYYY